ncbi:MAG: hypothetical protein VZR36_08890 [Prevotella sp.]|nr:hypothetical protein [Prevotella sp.]
MHDALQLQYDSVIEIAFTSVVGKGKKIKFRNIFYLYDLEVTGIYLDETGTMMVIHTDGEIPLYELNLDSKHSILLSLWGGTYLVEE